MLAKPVTGAVALLQGLSLLNTSGLRRFVVMPLLINIVLFIGSIYVLASQFTVLVDEWLTYLPEWLHWLEWLFWVLFALTALLLVFYTFSIIANIIAAPFNSLLAEAVEKHLTGQPLPSNGSLIDAFKQAPKAITDELRKLGYMLVLAIPVLILSFVIAPIAPFLWALFGAWMLALEYGDYPMGNHNIRFPDQRARLRQNKLLSLGFGGATLAATMIPLVNFLVMPAAVAGATKLWVTQLKE
ncbi:MAG: sulfate transporter CysZ [Chromatiales bacterium]|nr:sulfate transporter CysZ [Chromatiales bacterium]